VFLEVILDILAVNDTSWGKIVTGEEEGEEGLGSETAVVGAPYHGGERGGVGVIGKRVLGVDDGGLGCGKIAGVDTTRREGPVWGA